tara:strand:- start:2270 stop:2845 length:576 start_codon:yes stop_codon:yes gene_type:complete
MTERPKVHSASQKELDKVEKQFEEFNDNIKDLVSARSPDVKPEETEKQTKMSSNEIRNAKDIYLKPSKTLPDRQKFNEKFRKDWEYQQEYVNFVAEHKELIGETIEFWAHPFGGVGATYWEVPTNKPIWAPRYVAEQIQRKSYHRLVMTNTTTQTSGVGTFYGQLASDTKIQRLDAYPVRDMKSHFGSKGF